MLSVVVIGRNEGKRLRPCLESIEKALRDLSEAQTEVIYVDSASSDDSLGIACTFRRLRVFQILDGFNAAVARNIGAEQARGDSLMFVDGDMVVAPDFLRLVVNEAGDLLFDFVSGRVRYLIHNETGDLIGSAPFVAGSAQEDRYETTTGGIFLIRKSLWNGMKGMRLKYRRSQDLDLALRLARTGHKLLRKKERIADHISIVTTRPFAYLDSRRMWQMLWNGSFLYATSVLYRDHMFNPHIYPIIIRTDYTLLLMIILLVATFAGWTPVILSLAIYVVAIGARSVFSGHRTSLGILERWIFLLCKDISALIGFFVFYPRAGMYSYHQCQPRTVAP